MPGETESEQPARFLNAVDGAPLAYCQQRGRGAHAGEGR